jgi:hypothetical protein
MPALTSVQQLAELLTDYARPVIRPQRLSPSPIYDLDYRMAVLALVIRIHATSAGDGLQRIDSARLKLLQFVAQRPVLMPEVARWASKGASKDSLLGSSQRLRRGYMGDSTYDHVVDFMTAYGIVRWDGKYLTSASSNSYISSVFEASENSGMFASERAVLLELKGLRITNAMLEGE